MSAQLKMLLAQPLTLNQSVSPLKPINLAFNSTNLVSSAVSAALPWTTVFLLLVMELMAKTTGKSRTHGALPGVNKDTSACAATRTNAASTPSPLTQLSKFVMT
jgi:hypothetical protein